MRVLLVEDDRMIGEATVQALKDASYAVDWERDGISAIDAIEAISMNWSFSTLDYPKRMVFMCWNRCAAAVTLPLF